MHYGHSKHGRSVLSFGPKIDNHTKIKQWLSFNSLLKSNVTVKSRVVFWSYPTPKTSSALKDIIAFKSDDRVNAHHLMYIDFSLLTDTAAKSNIVSETRIVLIIAMVDWSFIVDSGSTIQPRSINQFHSISSWKAMLQRRAMYGYRIYPTPKKQQWIERHHCIRDRS